MTSGTRDGRVFQPSMTALAAPLAETGRRIEVRAPAVGLWRGGPRPGAMILPGDSLGEIEILGVRYRLEAPPDARGIVVEHGMDPGKRGSARRPVAFGQRMLVLDPDALGSAVAESALTEPQRATSAEGKLVFRAPMSGRFYSRPAPDKPRFVEVGDEVRVGSTICLLEVMKTFNRVTYGGEELPETARITAIVPAEEADLAAGDIILYLE